MKQQWPVVALALCGLAAICVLVSVAYRSYQQSEPRYRGKSLSRWMELLDGHQSAQAQKAIQAIGLQAVPFLLQHVREGDPCPAHAVYALHLFGPSAVPALAKALEDPDESVRLVAIRSLFLLKPELRREAPMLRPILIKLTHDPDPEVRFAAIVALGYVGPSKTEAVPELISALQDAHCGDTPSLCVRLKAASVLGRIGPPAQAAVPELTRLLADDNVFLARQAAMALWQITHETNRVLPKLADMLNDGNNETRHLAAAALLHIAQETNLDSVLIAKAAALRPWRIKSVAFERTRAGMALPDE